MSYIEQEALMEYPIRIDHYDKEHGNEDFVLGIESVLEYAENLPDAPMWPRCGMGGGFSSIRMAGPVPKKSNAVNGA